MNGGQGGGASRSTDPAAGTSSATDVSLREYFNEKISADRKLNRDRFMFGAALGGIVWFFIERHLAELNHENARVAKVSENSVSSDTYTANEAQRKSEQDKLDDRLARYDETFTKVATRDDLTRETRVGKRADIDTSTKVIAAIIAAGVLLLGILNYTALHRTTDTPPTPTVTVTTTTPTP